MTSTRVIARTLSAVWLIGVAPACSRPASSGALQVVSFPRGELLIDGQPTGARTPVQRHTVAAGRHVINVHADGVRFEDQPVSVVAGRTTHMYFRARDVDSDASSVEICATGAQDQCWARIDRAMREGRSSEARSLGEGYLRSHPDGGYASLVRSLVSRLGGDVHAPREADPE